MDLQKLYDRIQRQTDQGRFCLSGETAGLTAVSQLCTVFGMDEIALQETVCRMQEDQDMLTMQGMFCLSSSDEKLSFTLKAESGGTITTRVDLAGVYMDEDEWFGIRDGQLEIALQEGTVDFSEKLAGHVSLGEVVYSFQGERKETGERRQVILCREESTDSNEILDSGLALYGLSLSGFPVRPAPLEISFFSFSYTLPSRWLMSEAKEEKKDYFKWQIRTNLGFELQDVFGMRDIGFAMEKYGSAYELAMSGIFELFHHDFPFFLTYNGRGFTISLSECGQAELDSLDELGVLSGDENISGYLPKDFVPAGVISLYSLRLSLPSSFSSVSYFQIAVNVHFEWEISHSPSLIVHDIMLSYEYNPGSRFFSLAGTINFLGADTLLYTGMIFTKGKSGADWQFMWRMYDDESIRITDFAGQMAAFLGVPRTQITLPEVELCQVRAVYAAGGSFSFHAKVDVTESKLFSSETELTFVSKLVGEKRDYAAELSWKSTTNTLTIGNILEECGAGEALADVPAFLREIGLEEVELAYDLIENRISAEIEISRIGRLSVCLIFGEKKEYEVVFEPEIGEISLTGIPVAGGLVEKMLPSAGDFSISQFALSICSRENTQRAVPAGVCMSMAVFGKKQAFILYQPAPQNRDRAVLTEDPVCRQGAEAGKPKTVWIRVDKTFSILSIHRIGVGMDDARLALTLDAALNIPPLSFGAEGMGIGINMSRPSDIRFYLSGLSVAFRNDLLSVAGQFVKGDDSYEGELMIQVKQISVTAVGGYSADGSLMALAAVNYNFGGPPAFFVTGVSFGFGYHKDLVLPEVTEVPEHPLIQAARGRLSRKGLSEALRRYIKNVPGEKFIAAGIRFTSFNIVDSSIIVVAKFGNYFELGVLGLAEVSVPPDCPQTPVAYAGLALEAVVRPEAGYFGVEARLTSESYILSKACKLRGGFALYGWFGGEHSGDMVLTLGGYYPGYPKPQHYPSVPRVGFDWRIGDHLDISGEIYFALTPREIMAGGRLNAVYTLGNLRAWFIAAAEFIMGWKPFYYEASVRVQIGVSYRVDFFFVHHTFTVELGVGLDLWGPEFGGIAHISWFIISFDIHFGSRERNRKAAIGWDEFSSSFLPQAESRQESAGLQSDRGKGSVPVTIAFTDGVIKSGERTVCRGDGIQISVESAVPVTSYSVNGGTETKDGSDLYVQPMGGRALQSCFQIEIVDERGQRVEMEMATVRKNLPSALWGKKGGESMVRDAVCGLLLKNHHTEFTLFPIKHVISLDELYENGTIRIREAFCYLDGLDYPVYATEDSVEVFCETVDAEEVKKRREYFLAEQGICGAALSLGGYAANARNLLSEDFMVM